MPKHKVKRFITEADTDIASIRNYLLTALKRKYSSNPQFISKATQFLTNPSDKADNWMDSLTWENAKELVGAAREKGKLIIYTGRLGEQTTLIEALDKVYLNSYYNYNCLSNAIIKENDATAIYLLMIGATSTGEYKRTNKQFYPATLEQNPLLTALALKDKKKAIKIANLLLDLSLLSNNKNSYLLSTLQLALENDKIARADYLCTKYPELIPLYEGWLIAVKQFNFSGELVDFLNKFKFNINAKDTLGNTPIHLSTKSMRIDEIRSLIKSNATLTLTNDDNLMPFEIASKLTNPIFTNHETFIEFLAILRTEIKKDPTLLTDNVMIGWVNQYIMLHTVQSKSVMTINNSMMLFLYTSKEILSDSILASPPFKLAQGHSDLLLSNIITMAAWIISIKPSLKANYLLINSDFLKNNPKYSALLDQEISKGDIQISPLTIKPIMKTLLLMNLISSNQPFNTNKNILASLIMETLLKRFPIESNFIKKLVSTYQSLRYQLVNIDDAIGNLLDLLRSKVNKGSPLHSALNTDIAFYGVKSTYEMLLLNSPLKSNSKAYETISKISLNWTAAESQTVTHHVKPYPTIFHVATAIKRPRRMADDAANQKASKKAKI